MKAGEPHKALRSEPRRRREAEAAIDRRHDLSLNDLLLITVGNRFLCEAAARLDGLAGGKRSKRGFVMASTEIRLKCDRGNLVLEV